MKTTDNHTKSGIHQHYTKQQRKFSNNPQTMHSTKQRTV